MPNYNNREFLNDYEHNSEEFQADLSNWQNPAQLFQAKLKARLLGEVFESPIQKIVQASLRNATTNNPENQTEVLQAKSETQNISSTSSSENRTLPSDIKQSAESTLQEDLSDVQIKENENASQIGALAYTQGNEITFAPGQFQPDTQKGKELIGHELTHVKQQRENRVQPTTQAKGLPVNDDKSLEREADNTGRSIASGNSNQSRNSTNSTSTSSNTTQLKPIQASTNQLRGDSRRLPDMEHVSREGVIQGSFISDMMDAIDNVPGVSSESIINNIPGYRLFSLLIEYDVLRDRNVTRSPRNMIQALMELPPGGSLLFSKLDEYGIIDGAFNWVSDELSRLNLSQDRIERAISTAWDLGSLNPFDFTMDDELVRQLRPIYRDVERFADSALDALIDLLTDALVHPLVDYLSENSDTYRLATKVLHRKFPLEDSVEASTEEIIRDFLILIGKETEVQQMEERGTLQEMAEWIDTQWNRFENLTERFLSIVNRAWDAFSIEELSNITGVFADILDEFLELLNDFTEFAAEVAEKVLELVKKVLLNLLSEEARETRGYTLITVLLGKDPFTEEEVPRSATNIIRAFLELLPGGEATFQRLQESGAIDRMTNWIEGAVDSLGITWDFIVNLFTDLWNSFTIDDLVNPLEAFARIIQTFGEPISRVLEFIFEVVKAILQFVLEVMNFPTQIIVSIVENAMQAYDDIKRDPLNFFVNLFQAMKQGFQQFFENIGTHLLSGLTDWLFGQMTEAGITPPSDLSFQSILNLVLEILGISTEQIMQKIGERIGPERMEQIQGYIDQAVGVFGLVSDVIDRGPIALWERIEQQLSNLWDMVLEGVRNWITEQIITRVSARLLTMLDPTGIGAAINTAIAFFNAVQSFIQYLTEMLQIVDTFVQGVANIARGQLTQAAGFLEGALADGIPVAIGFLANQVGLGDLGRRIGEMIQALQERVDQAIDSVLDWVAEQMRNIMRGLGMGQGEGAETMEDVSPESQENIRRGLNAIDVAEGPFLDSGKIAEGEANEVASQVRRANPIFTDLQVVARENRWDYRYQAGQNTQGVYETTGTGRAPVIQRAPMEEAQGDKFDRILHQAMRELGSVNLQAGSTDTEDHTVASQPTGSLTTPEQVQTDDIPDSQSPETSDLSDPRRETNEQAQEESLRIHQEIMRVYREFVRARQANEYPANTFLAGSARFFIIRNNNNYIAPNREASPHRTYFFTDRDGHTQDIVNNYLVTLNNQIDIWEGRRGQAPEDRVNQNITNLTAERDSLSSMGIEARRNFITSRSRPLLIPSFRLDQYNGLATIIGVPRAVPGSEDFPNEFDYHGNPLPLPEARDLYRNFPAGITEARNHTTFIAALVVEPDRRSHSHISNMLTLDPRAQYSEQEEESSVFEHTAMTQPGSHRVAGSQATIDTYNRHQEIARERGDAREEARVAARLRGVNADPRLRIPENAPMQNVTDLELASVRRHPDLMQDLNAVDLSQTDEIILNSFIQIIRRYLNLPN